jgi:hypothetical protein
VKSLQGLPQRLLQAELLPLRATTKFTSSQALVLSLFQRQVLIWSTWWSLAEEVVVMHQRITLPVAVAVVAVVT